MMISSSVMFVGIGAFLLNTLLQSLWISYCKRKSMSQAMKEYGPSHHISLKAGTPSMGGVVFIITFLLFSVLIYIIEGPALKKFLPIVGIPFTAGCIGFLDDFLKHRKNSSEGFSSLGKLALQVLLTAPWVYFLVSSGNNMLLHEVKFWGPVVAFLFLFLIVGSMNAVNITDGLDGLAAGSCAISFLAMSVLLHFSKSELMISIVGLAIAVSFLWHNAHPAKVFMGDTGSHFLGGLLASMSICTGNALMLIPFSFLMGVEILSVILQLLSIHLRGKKIFKMSPLHHHFELIGWKETQVVVRFWLIHVVGMVTFIVTFNMLGLIE